MSDVVSIAGEVSGAGEPGGPNDGFEALASLNEGFLGTGFSSSVELSFVGMGFIIAYVMYSTARYFLEGRQVGARFMTSIATALGLGDD